MARQARMGGTEKCFEEKLRAKFDTSRARSRHSDAYSVISLLFMAKDLTNTVTPTSIFYKLHCIRMQILNLDFLWQRRQSMISQEFWSILYVAYHDAELKDFSYFMVLYLVGVDPFTLPSGNTTVTILVKFYLVMFSQCPIENHFAWYRPSV